MTNNALIGYSGFVGSTLLKQHKFDALYRSSNIADIQGKTFDTLVCAAAPGVKWLANSQPEQDKQSIDNLIANLSTVKCKRMVLISTVDVFKNPNHAKESTPVDTSGLAPYGANRYALETFVQNHFSEHIIVRLAGLIGPGLKKNVIYDFLNNNRLASIESRNIFQFYPMVNLWADIQLAISHQCQLIHLTAEPISVGEIATQGFNFDFSNTLNNEPISYDIQSEFSHLYGSNSPYQYSKKETLMMIRYYAQTELPNKEKL